MKSKWQLLFMGMPFLLLVLLFSYIPLFGWAVAFFDFKPGIPLFENTFVGLDNFRYIFTDLNNTARVMKNTVAFAGIGLLITPLPMLFAVLLNEISSNRSKRLIQTFTTIPNFIGWVIVYSVCFSIFSNEGLLNQILLSFGLIDTPVNLLTDNDNVYVFQSALNIWKTLGWNAVLYIAAIAGIEQDQYDSAKVDGAGYLQTALYITVPSILNTFWVLLLLNIGNFLNQGMEQYYLFQNSMNSANIEVLDLYAYKQGILKGDYGFAIAVGILKSTVSIALIFTANGISKRFRGASII